MPGWAAALYLQCSRGCQGGELLAQAGLGLGVWQTAQMIVLDGDSGSLWIGGHKGVETCRRKRRSSLWLAQLRRPCTQFPGWA